MARHTFAGGPSDYVLVTTSGTWRNAGPSTCTVWSAETGGTQVTDLLIDGQAATAVRLGSTGRIPSFEGPDGVEELWLEVPGVPARVRLTRFGAQGPTGPGADVTGAEIEAARDEAQAAQVAAEAAAAAAEAGGTSTDAVMAARLADPESQSGQVLAEAIASQASTTGSEMRTALDLVYAKLNSVRPATIPAEQTLAYQWRPDRSAYNVKTTNLTRARAGAGKARAGNGYCTVCVIGTSISGGTGASTSQKSWPSFFQARQIQRSMIDGGSGFIPAHANLSATPETRVTLGTGWGPFSAGATCLAQGTQQQPITFADNRPSTKVRIWYIDFFSFQLAWTIDGVAQTPITLGNTGTLKSVEVTGLTSGNHTVVITPGSGVSGSNPAYVMGVEFRNATGVVVNNLGVGGMNSTNAANTQPYRPLQIAKAMQPNLTIVELGANDGTGATYSANLQTIITQMTGVGSDVVIVGTPPVGAAGSARPIAVVLAADYARADSSNLPLVDLSDRMVSWNSANALGLTFNDGLDVHWNEAANALFSATIDNALEL